MASASVLRPVLAAALAQTISSAVGSWMPQNLTVHFNNLVGFGPRKQPVAETPLDHPLYHTLHDIKSVSYSPLVERDFGRMTEPALEGITIDGKLAVIYSRFDLGDGWEMFPHPFSRGYGSKDALKIGTNILVYALTH